MNTKQRDVLYQNWRRVIQRETRDLASLERNRIRALADRNVHGDPTLESMIQADLQNRRRELEQESQIKRSSVASARSMADEPSVQLEPTPATPPAQVREAFGRLAQTLSTSLERGDETETRAVVEEMKALQEQNPRVIPAAGVADYERRVGELRAHIKQLTEEISLLAQQAVSASHNGNEQDLARSLCRLTSIHVAHPRLLDESGLENVRRDVADAADEGREHRLTTKTLLERERAITAEIKPLAAAVRAFHQVACSVPDTSAEFCKAEAAYLRAIQEVRTYDTEWFAGLVLELAGLLAQWTVPPPGAGRQIDRFLDAIGAGLDRIRAEMREIENEQESDDGGGSDSVAP